MFNFIVLLIVIFGSLNWFAIGVFQFDLIAGIFGSQSVFFSRFVYTVIGLAGFWSLFVTLFKKGNVVYYVKKPKQKRTRNSALATAQTSSENDSQTSSQNADTDGTGETITSETPPNETSMLVSERTTEQEKIYDIPPAKPLKASHPKLTKRDQPADQPKI